MQPDYNKLKKELSIEKVLDEYGLKGHLIKSRDKLYGPCPLHWGDNPKAFNASLDKGLWNCFTHCGGGSVIDLIMEIENIPARQAAQTGYEILGQKLEKIEEESGLKPLNFKLNLDPEHPYLKERGIEIETARYFEIGYCNKGIMNRRIAIPIQDENDNLVAYCGRAVDDENPRKYLFPKGFQKNKIIYNLNRLQKKNLDELILVEGFFDVFKLYQEGYESAAVMGSSISLYQKQQIDSLDKRLTVMFDGDEAGRKGIFRAIQYFTGKRSLKVLYLPENKQPEHLTSEILKGFLG
ncbi:toprim domain-containing protein [Caldithrix abyssi]|nr:toprim domain-containing protein [Caldithrix abyssi]